MLDKKQIITFVLFIVFVFSMTGNAQEFMIQKGSPIKYLALGDSYTIGEKVLESEQWPIQLRDSLIKRGYEFDFVDVVANTGWTTDELNDGISANVSRNDYDLVSLLIGVNNQYRGRSIDEFRMHFKDLLSRATKFCGKDRKKIFVLSIPDWGVTPFAKEQDSKKIASEIDNFNSIKKKICNKLGVAFFDITSISREAESDSTLLAADGLHPSGKMYAQWVSLILPDVIKMLEE